MIPRRRYFDALAVAYRRLDAQLATDGGARTCERCGDTVTVAPNRFQIRAYDFTESTGALLEGRLCSYCWDDFMAFLAGDWSESTREHARQTAIRVRRETRRGGEA